MHFAVVIVNYSMKFRTCQRLGMIFHTFGELHIFWGVFMCDLYKTIETYCQKNNIKIADLARNTGLNKTLFSDLKNGRSKTLSIDRLIIIADYFNISLDELVGRKRKTPDDKSSEVIDKIMKLLSAMTPEQKAAFVQTAEALILPNSKE